MYKPPLLFLSHTGFAYTIIYTWRSTTLRKKLRGNTGTDICVLKQRISTTSRCFYLCRMINKTESPLKVQSPASYI